MMRRIVPRVAGGLMAATLLVLWGFLVRYLFAQSGQQPAPALFALPLFFVGLAAWALVAAIRGEAIGMVVAGGLSFVPTGAVLLFMPGFPRWIGILDLGVVASGLMLLRWGAKDEDWGSGEEASNP